MPSSRPKRTVSAGGVVVGPDGKVALVSQRGNSWSLPKGHIEDGESVLEAARREIFEETGLHELEFVKELGAYERYRIGKGGTGENKSELKRMVFFLFSTRQTELSPQDPKHPEAQWVDPAQVAPLLTHPKDRAFFESIQEHLSR